MSRLATAIALDQNQTTARTYNGAITNKTTMSKLVDLFFIAAASRGKDLTQLYAQAHNEDSYLAKRLALWLRDARQGAGERTQFRNLYRWLINNDRVGALDLLYRVPELGRWDDVLIGLGTSIEPEVISLIRKALFEDRDGLAGKWLPRKGIDAVRLRRLLGLSPKQYRKQLVELSNTVEQLMCANKWEKINLSHVPSVAFSRSKKAFSRHAPQLFTDFVNAVKKGEATIHASAIFPYDIIHALRSTQPGDVREATNEQWKALPNFLEDAVDERVLVMADSSGSMTQSIDGKSKVSVLDVAVSLALYMSERLTGPFKDTFLTFSGRPELQKVSGSLFDRVAQIDQASWTQNTDLQAAFKLVLNTAVRHQLPEADMPTKIVIISDMEFDAATREGYYDRKQVTNYDAVRAQYTAAGYKLPQLVFWNVKGRLGNNPATIDTSGVALISGYSPAVAKSVLSCKNVTPIDVMLETLMSERYDF